MRRTTTAAALAAALFFAGTGCSSYTVEDCKNAIAEEHSKTNRPKECEDLSQKDYDLILSHWALKKAFNDMDKEDQDILDLYDDGSVNGSVDPE
ncbi:hypothetical protein [Streptomyces sp. NPDC001268]|uniref:hypothetical protein n=1 Tax=Streptomyces sp. NPDC001268 TaxID=3364553 RepID=UPI0036912D80